MTPSSHSPAVKALNRQLLPTLGKSLLLALLLAPTLWLLGSAMLILIGLQLVVSWIVMRVLETLSLRELRIEEEFRSTGKFSTI